MRREDKERAKRKIKSLYEILGVARDAAAVEIRKAYLLKARDLHPDCPSGSTEAFQELQHAYSILSDERLRRAYDQKGDESGPSDEERLEQMAHQMMNGFMAMVLQDPGLDPENSDVLGLMLDSVRRKLHNGERKMSAIRSSRSKAGRVYKRMKPKQIGRNIAREAILAQIQSFSGLIERGDQELMALRLMLKMLKENTYDFDRTSPRYAYRPDTQMIDPAAASRAWMRSGGASSSSYG